MKKSEVFPIIAGSLLFASAVVLAMLKSLPVMKIDDVRTDGFIMTPSIFRIAGTEIGLCYPSVDRQSLKKELASLPYISDSEITYDKGSLLLALEGREGSIIVSEDEASFFSGGENLPLSLDDVYSLRNLYPVISIGNVGKEEALKYLQEVIPSIVSSRLITWIECVNNNEDGSIKLRIALPELNATLILSESSAIGRLEESIGMIKEENRANPGRTVFFSPSVYELYSDRLVRNKR